MPDNFEQLGFKEEKAPTDFGALGFVPQPAKTLSDTTPTDVIKNLLGIGKTGLQIPVVAGQDLGSLVAGIPGAMPLARKITGALPENVRRGLAALKTDRVIDKPTLGAQIGGGLLGGAVGAEAGAGLAGGLLGKIPGAAKLATAFPKIAPRVRRLVGGGLFGTAVAPPGHRKLGAAIGGLAAGSLGEIEGALKAIPKMDVVLRSRLGQRVINGYNAVKKVSTKLYNTAFEGTEDITPKLTDKAQANINELKVRYPGERGAVPRSIIAYEKDKTLKNAHFLKSNLGDEWQKLEVKKKSPTATFTKEDEADQEAIQDTRNNLDKSLENNFNKLSPNKKVQYDKAQMHFKEKVAPFHQKGHTAIMKAISPDRDLTNKLFSEIGADSVKASKVRDVLRLSLPQLEIARLLRNKLITIPALTVAGIGTAIGLRGHKSK